MCETTETELFESLQAKAGTYMSGIVPGSVENILHLYVACHSLKKSAVEPDGACVDIYSRATKNNKLAGSQGGVG